MQERSVKSAIRVLEIFELFAARNSPLSQRALIESLGYPQSSMTMLLKSLVNNGYLNYDSRGRVYLPTPKFSMLGVSLSKLMAPQSVVIDFTNRLYQQTRETIGLAVQSDIYIQFIKFIDSQHELRVVIPEGTMRYLTNTAAGWILLSEWPDPIIDKICRKIIYRARDDSDRANVEYFQGELKQIRERGYVYLRNIPYESAGGIAMMLPEHVHPQRLAVAVGGYIGRMDKNQNNIIEWMREAVAKL
jgi:DNA-binding IclR family transcriptional regulator